MYKSYKSYGMYYHKLHYVLCNVSNWCIFADDKFASFEPCDNLSSGIMIGILCLSWKNLNMYISYLNSDTVGHRTWPSVCITPRSQRHRCYGCGSWKCNLHPRICFVCWMKHAVPGATLRTVDGKSWAPVGRKVSIPVVVNGRRNC